MTMFTPDHCSYSGSREDVPHELDVVDALLSSSGVGMRVGVWLELPATSIEVVSLLLVWWFFFASCVLRLASCVLRLASCVLRLASCVLRLASCVLRFASSVVRLALFSLVAFGRRGRWLHLQIGKSYRRGGCGRFVEEVLERVCSCKLWRC
ncbi:hypothetical protein CC86DRAFT_373776 [Ophiobolus disseminans]|uniref:Uncharacterized protein n=1 Tax=Ophiobolus disseminans TaxID=1469910 RepID=A0A6A6ZKM8_9PLEO|nr:hypothetical protein CC86DRAFT_373776 [Ophiobolus disseminans]